MIQLRYFMLYNPSSRKFRKSNQDQTGRMSCLVKMYYSIHISTDRNHFQWGVVSGG